MVFDVCGLSFQAAVSHSKKNVMRIARPKWKTFSFILGLIVIAYWLTDWLESLGGPQGLKKNFGFLGPILSIPLHTVLALSPFPSGLIGIVNGTVYGFWLGSFFSWLAWYLASFIEFGFGRCLKADFDLDRWLSRAPERLKKFPVEHPAFLIGSRCIPYAGSHLATVLPGALGIRVTRFSWCTALSIIPPAMFTSAIGAGLWWI